jgi:transcriptional regulator with XRE-family HTH domain
MHPDHVGTFVAQRLKALREARGYSLRKLAHRSDITPEMLSRAERCERIPSLETIARVCEGLEMSLSEFFEAAALPIGNPHWPAPDGLTPAAREHFLDALRSLQRGMAAAAAPPTSLPSRRGQGTASRRR